MPTRRSTHPHPHAHTQAYGHSLLVVLVVLAVAAGAAWLLLGRGDALESLDDGAGEEAFDPEETGVSAAPDEPARRTEPLLVEPPAAPLPRIAVFSEDEEFPSSSAEVRAAQDRLHETMLDGDRGGLGGPELIRAVSEAAYLRVRSQGDLEALKRVGPDPAWGEAPLPLVEVIELWRREGFEVEDAGPVLIVSRTRD